MTLYGFGMARNASAPTDGPIALEGLEEITIQAVADFILENPDDLERRLQMSLFAQRCNVLQELRDVLRQMEADL